MGHTPLILYRIVVRAVEGWEGLIWLTFSTGKRNSLSDDFSQLAENICQLAESYGQIFRLTKSLLDSSEHSLAGT